MARPYGPGPRRGRAGCRGSVTRSLRFPHHPRSAPAFPPFITYARQTLGRRGEALAAARLQRAGWRIVARNVRLPSGELDLVALEGRTLVFVEVKTARAGNRLGPERPAHAVGPRKQLKLRRLAREWIAERRGPSGVAG